jgi:aspartyl protease
MKLARILALPLAAAICAAAWGHSRREPARVEVPFETTRGGAGLMTIRVTVNGKTGDFLFDTGDELTLLDREFAGFKSEKPKPEKNGAHPDGQSGISTMKQVVLGPVCIEKHCFEKRTVGIAELGFFPRLGRRIDGIIGQDLLREFDEVTINYKKSTVTFSTEGQ